MVYGVDQCRVCGVPIHPEGPEEYIEWEEAQRKPLIPEKEWRRRGFLAAPTAVQLRLKPALGCCPPCGRKLMHQRFRYNIKAALWALGVPGLFWLFGYIIAYERH